MMPISIFRKGGKNFPPIVTIANLPHSEFKSRYICFIKGIEDATFSEYFVRYEVESFVFNTVENSESLYNFYLQNLSNIYSTYEMLADDESKKVLMAYVKGRITNKLSDYCFAPEPQYFLTGFLPGAGDIAIDGGAYDGATSRDFAMQGAKVYAFEMDAKNYQNCFSRAEKYHFTIENLGLSNQEGEEYYNSSDTGSRKGYGNSVAKFTDLDTYVKKKNLPRVDYIKLDIEGAELDMLHGAVKTISRWKPKMAVSAYHKLEDLWTLANYIKSIRSDYEFHFRHYKIDCRDYTLKDSQRAVLRKFGLDCFVPTCLECVLYCR